MSKLEELIKELCPNGVEYFNLYTLFDNFSGMTAVTNKWAENGNCQFIDYMNAYKHIEIDINDLPYATVKDITKQNNLMQGDVLFTSASETPNECALSSVIMGQIKSGVLLDDHLFGLRLKEQYRHIVEIGYLKYVFRANSFRKGINKTVRGVTRFYISKPDFMALQIPLPPLAVQREIVRILDKFTLLSQELAAELAARRVQYEHYRDRLVSFDDKNKQIKWVLLQDVLEIKNGSDYKRFGEGQYPVYGSGGVMTYIDNFIYDKPSVLIPRKGSLNNLFYVETPFWTVDTIFYTIIDTTKVVPKFVFYYLQNQHLEKLNKAGGVPSLTQSVLNLIKFPIPPLEVQERIVKVLDNFDAICSDLGIGLPAEIEKRQQQYEYYRDKLLTFDIASATIFSDRQTDRQTDRQG